MSKFISTRTVSISIAAIGLAFVALACDASGATPSPLPEVPHEERWGIYKLNLTSQSVDLIYSSPNEITTARPTQSKMFVSVDVGSLSIS